MKLWYDERKLLDFISTLPAPSSLEKNNTGEFINCLKVKYKETPINKNIPGDRESGGYITIKLKISCDVLDETTKRLER